MCRECCWIVLLPLFLTVGCERSETQDGRSSNQPDKPRARVWVKREFLEKASDDQIERILVTCLSNIIGGDHEHEVEIVRSWTSGKRMLYTTHILESEISNGGFVQFFWDTKGWFSQMVLAGLKLIGAERHADLMQRAIRIYEEEAELYFQQPMDDDTEAFDRAVKNSALTGLDDEFFGLTEDLRALRVKFIRDHLDEFATPS